MTDTKVQIDQGIKTIRGVINSAQHVHPPQIYEDVIHYGVMGIFSIFIALGITFILWWLGIISSSAYKYMIEFALVACLIIYSIIAFYIISLKRRLHKLYGLFPCAMFIIWNMDRYEKTLDYDTLPSFFQFHRLPNNYILNKWLVPMGVGRGELALVETEFSHINEILKNVCLSNRHDVLRYLISVCKLRANQQSTYRRINSLRDFDKPHFEIISLKEILQRSINSSFCMECINDIVEGNFQKYPINNADYKNVVVNEQVVFDFYEPLQISSASSGIILYTIPAVLFSVAVIYGTGCMRYLYVEYALNKNIENKRIAEAVSARLDILEESICNGIAYEPPITIPLRYSISYKHHDHAPYVGDVSCSAYVEYNDYKNTNMDGEFLYTLDTDIRIVSEARECDNVPAHGFQSQIIRLTEKDLAERKRITQSLIIRENMGRYAGATATEYFTYSFSLSNGRYPVNQNMLNSMFYAYDNCINDHVTKKDITKNYFTRIDITSPLEIISLRCREYDCINLYDINLRNEVSMVKKLTKYKKSKQRKHNKI